MMHEPILTAKITKPELAELRKAARGSVRGPMAKYPHLDSVLRKARVTTGPMPHATRSLARMILLVVSLRGSGGKPINERELARRIVKLEGKKLSISIAQVKEVLGIVLRELAKEGLPDIRATLDKHRAPKGH